MGIHCHVQQILVGIPKNVRPTADNLFSEFRIDYSKKRQARSAGIMFTAIEDFTNSEIKRFRDFAIVPVSESFSKAYFFNMKLKPNRNWYMFTLFDLV